MRISDWSSDVCSSDLLGPRFRGDDVPRCRARARRQAGNLRASSKAQAGRGAVKDRRRGRCSSDDGHGSSIGMDSPSLQRSEEHTSELQSLMRISYVVFLLKKKKTQITNQNISI